MSPYSPVAAFRPSPSFRARTFSTTTAALEAGVHGDLLDRLLERTAHDLRAGELVALEVDLVERRLGVQQGHAAAGTMPSSTAAFVDCTASSMRCFFSLSSTSVAAPTLITATPPESFGQPLLQLLAVVVGVGLLDLALIWLMRPCDVLVLAGALDDRRLVLRDDDLASGAEQVHRRVLELEADLLGDDRRAGEDRDVLQHRLAAVTEPGAFTAVE
jgi:hypothetical protein